MPSIVQPTVKLDATAYENVEDAQTHLNPQ